MLVGNDPPRSDSIGDRASKVFGQLPHLFARTGTFGPIAAVEVDQIRLRQ